MLAFVTRAAIALALTGTLAARASAQCAVPPNVLGTPADTVVGGFHIDCVVPGDATHVTPAGVVQINDKSSPPAAMVLETRPEIGPVNNSSTKLNVINTASTSPKAMLGTSNPNPQTDLRRIWLASSQNGTEAFLYFGWERDSGGTGTIMFEFQQAKVPAGCDYSNLNTSTCNPWSGRQPNDFIIVWDQSGNVINIIKRTFLFHDTNPANGVWDGPVKEPLYLDAGVQLGGADVAAGISVDGLKGEAGINLSTTVFPSNPSSCFSVANIIVGTVTGNSDSADFKDTILFPYPETLTISNCGKVLVRKVTNTGESDNFDYKLIRYPTNAALRYADDGGALLLTGTKHGGSVGNPPVPEPGDVLDKLVPGTDYRLTEENIPAGWVNSSISCQIAGESALLGAQFTVRINVTTTCTIYNDRGTGTLTVVKIVVNGYGLTAGPGDFHFNLGDGVNTNFVVDQPTNPSGSDRLQHSFPLVHGTAFTVTETQLPNYSPQASGTCTGSIVAGQNVVCTYTNTATAATPSSVTRQRVLLFDRMNISGRRTGAGSGGSVTFRLYSDNVCQNELGFETVQVPNTTDANIQVGTAAIDKIIELNSAGTNVSTTRSWRASYTGDAYNTGTTTQCNEVTTVTFSQ